LPRAPGSVRRTTSIDITFPDGIGNRVVADIRGRDLRTNADGSSEPLDQLAVTMTLDPWTVVITEATAPLGELVGLELRGAFAQAVGEHFPDDAARRSLCYSALEDLRGAHLVSGYAALRAGLIPDVPEFAAAAIERQGDICVGWAVEGPVIGTLRDTGHNPVPVGPVAPLLDGDDALGWHAVAMLAAHTVRRRRRTDVGHEDGELRVVHHFRDSHCDDDGTERVMHEYLVHAAFDDHEQLASIDAEARVLPWYECPGALVSAQQLIGVHLDEFPARVRRDLKGVTTCTHLNSTLRTLADAHALAQIAD
jgi:hypothetical protein